MSKSTRLRFVAGSSPEELAAFIQRLKFKVEIKSIVPQGKMWFCWFVLPDNISNKEADEVKMPSLNLDEI